MTVAVLLQYLRFGSVGVAATAGHALLFGLLIGALGWRALLANLAAFAGAVLLSFAGHRYWTFGAGGRQGSPLPALGRFTLAAAAGLGLNSLFVWTVVDLLRCHYGYALAPMVTVTPAALFVAGKLWIFAAPAAKPHDGRAGGCPARRAEVPQRVRARTGANLPARSRAPL